MRHPLRQALNASHIIPFSSIEPSLLAQNSWIADLMNVHDSSLFSIKLLKSHCTVFRMFPHKARTISTAAWSDRTILATVALII